MFPHEWLKGESKSHMRIAVYDSSNVIIIKSLKEGIACPSIYVKLFRSNIGPSALIIKGYAKGFSHRFCNPAS